MPSVKTRISVSGFHEAEVRAGLPDLLDEFKQRPWILRPAAVWDPERSRLVVDIQYQGDDPVAYGRAASDEIWDCVIACFNFSSEGIHFDAEDSVVIPDR